MPADPRPSGFVRPAPRWELAPAPSTEAVEALQRTLGLPRALCAVLAVRGFVDPDAAKRFLRPEVGHLHEPSLLPDLDRAVERIDAALSAGERILVHGDYDVDGITGSALLTEWLRSLGGDVVPFVPHRIHDGYDFGPSGVARAREVGAKLVVTVDCGIRAHDAVAAAVGQGMDVIVTDHHTPAESLPDAYAVVNPNRRDSTYPNKGLAGAGVAFKLCQRMAERRGHDVEDLLSRLDLVALASIADLVPLTDENRVLTRIGLRALERTSRPGLRALLQATGLDGHDLEAGNVGFVLAPPINAAGRIAESQRALDLMLDPDLASAARLAAELVALNKRRQDEDKRTLAEALDLLADMDASQAGVVVAREGWHPGVIGIVASRLVERIHRPVVVVALDGERGRGSARSIPGFDLYDAIDSCGDVLERYGGHTMAAGLDVRAERLHELRTRFAAAVSERMVPEIARPRLRPDVEIGLDEIDDRLVDLMRWVGPFGIGNPRPLFLARGLPLGRPPRVVGKGHLSLDVQWDRRRFGGIGFGMADRVPPASLGTGPVDAVFQVRRETWQGRTSLRLRLSDVRSAS